MPPIESLTTEDGKTIWYDTGKKATEYDTFVFIGPIGKDGGKFIGELYTTDANHNKTYPCWKVVVSEPAEKPTPGLLKLDDGRWIWYAPKETPWEAGDQLIHMDSHAIDTSNYGAPSTDTVRSSWRKILSIVE